MSFDVWEVSALLQYMELIPIVHDDFVRLPIGKYVITYKSEGIVVDNNLCFTSCWYPWSYLIAHDVTEMIQKRIMSIGYRRNLARSC